jgi:hypothetical protein
MARDSVISSLPQARSCQAAAQDFFRKWDHILRWYSLPVFLQCSRRWTPYVVFFDKTLIPMLINFALQTGGQGFMIARAPAHVIYYYVLRKASRLDLPSEEMPPAIAPLPEAARCRLLLRKPRELCLATGRCTWCHCAIHQGTHMGVLLKRCWKRDRVSHFLKRVQQKCLFGTSDGLNSSDRIGCGSICSISKKQYPYGEVGIRGLKDDLDDQWAWTYMFQD